MSEVVPHELGGHSPHHVPMKGTHRAGLKWDFHKGRCLGIYHL